MSDDDYRGSHRAPGIEDAPLWNLAASYPDDIYGPLPLAVRYYGLREDPRADVEVMRLAQSYRDLPNARVMIFRAVPKGASIKSINDGDWVTIYEPYARYHGNSRLGGKFKILSKTVEARNVFTNADSIYEYGYVRNV